jgi:SAM-dependent methyltransferase
LNTAATIEVIRNMTNEASFAQSPLVLARSARKRAVLEEAERRVRDLAHWLGKSRFFKSEDLAYLRFLIPAGKRVVDLGCGTGAALAALEPSHGVGVDLSPTAIATARRNHPSLSFIQGDAEDPALLGALDGPADYILLSDALCDFEDVETTLTSLHDLCNSATRIVVVSHSPLWAPILKLAELLGLKMRAGPKNWLWHDDIETLMSLADFEIIHSESRVLSPARLFGLGWFLNRYVATLPLVGRLCLRDYIVARSRVHAMPLHKSATVVIPARNERGNIEPAIQRLPRFCDDLEIIFVEGHSKDGTLDEMKRVQAAYPDLDIKVLTQDGKGKADAVWKGFDAARGDVLMILDADLTMPPESLPKFWRAIALGKGEFINGSRLVYPLEDGAMQFLNLIANHSFSMIFSWLLNQRLTDTLCGTKALSRQHYRQIKASKSYFGDFDPFGDFDLIFGAAKQNLRIVEIPIRYASRTYGETQISRFRHGLMLLRMVAFAYGKLKAI